MTPTDHIQTRPDGSIDTAHYIRIGHRHRSAAFRSMVAAPRPVRARSGLLTGLLVAFGLPWPK